MLKMVLFTHPVWILLSDKESDLTLKISNIIEILKFTFE